jgi:hypothetical protein
VEPIQEPTLFEIDKPEDAGPLAQSAQVERPFYEPGLLLGTSAFTAAGWEWKIEDAICDQMETTLTSRNDQ